MMLLSAIYTFIAEDEAEWIRKLAVVESSENWSKEGDDGLAVGLWQQHPDFQSQWVFNNAIPAQQMPEEIRWSDEIQIAALYNFWRHYRLVQKLSAQEVMLIYHYGYKKWDELHGLDPDNYWQKIQEA